MPITFSVTCDTDAELAQFLKNVSFGSEFAATTTQKLGKATTATKAKSPTQATASGAVKKTKVGRPKLAKSPTIKKRVTKAPKGLNGSRPGRKAGKLTPVIESAVQEMIKKGKPFRSREVTEYIMKKTPELNESSVITGVSKHLSESPLKWDQIKDAVGRPYKLYKP